LSSAADRADDRHQVAIAQGGLDVKSQARLDSPDLPDVPTEANAGLTGSRASPEGTAIRAFRPPRRQLNLFEPDILPGHDRHDPIF
jgi:hypothetical protein